MAITTQASHALGLIAGIDLCHEPEPGYWRSLAARLVLDLDEAGHAQSVAVVLATLREQWGLFSADPERAKPLAEHPGPFKAAVISGEDLHGLEGLALGDRFGERVRELFGEDGAGD